MNRPIRGYQTTKSKSRAKSKGWSWPLKKAKGRGDNHFSNRYVAPNNNIQTSKKPASTRPWAYYVLAALALSALTWLLGFSGWFNVQTIDVSQNKNIPAEELSRAVRSYFNDNRLTSATNHNWLLMDGAELKAKLMDEFPLQDVKIYRRPKKLKIKLAEKDYAYIWQEADKFYYINQEGDIILTKEAAIKNFPLIVNEATSSLTGKKINVNSSILAFVKALDDTLKANNHGLSLRYFVYDTTYNCLKIQLTAGPTLLFNTQVEPESQLLKLDSLRRQEFSDGQKFNSLKYIDLRFGERVYFQ